MRKKWKPMSTAPTGRFILIKKNDRKYVAQWVQDFVTGDIAWSIADLGEDGRVIVKDPDGWMELPE